MNLRGEEKENFTRQRALTSKEEKNTKENIIDNQVPRTSVGHAEKYNFMQMNAKNKNKNELIEVLGSFYCFELNKDEALDLALEKQANY